jgi:phenylalanyl-tRNA synthetase beta subunit
MTYLLPLANFKVGGDLVESVQKIDEYEDKKRSRVSHAYRVVYRHMDK